MEFTPSRRKFTKKKKKMEIMNISTFLRFCGAEFANL